jgi:hypothetical protein
MGFLLLGIDSLIACLAVGALVDRRWRLPLAALFGFADGAAFLIGAGLGWTLSARLTEILGVGTLVVLGLYLLVVAAGSRRLAELSVWVVPFALIMDNLAYGVANDYAGSLAGQAVQQTASSSLLGLVGLLVVAAVLPRVEEHRTAAARVAGGALLLVAGAFVLAG